MFKKLKDVYVDGGGASDEIHLSEDDSSDDGEGASGEGARDHSDAPRASCTSTLGTVPRFTLISPRCMIASVD